MPLAHVAAEAGVGVGTLYRRYSNREALLEALQVRAYRLLIGRAESALESGETGLDALDRFKRPASRRATSWSCPCTRPLDGRFGVCPAG